MKRLFQSIQLGQSLDKFQDIILQIRFSEEALAGHVIQRQAYPGLVEPHLPHDVVEQGHDADSAQPVALLKLGEHPGPKIIRT